jgi:protocatechuate 3,4-dioxygenase beta subunit
MRNVQVLVAFYLSLALAVNCRGQVAGAAENVSPQNPVGSQADDRARRCPVAGTVVNAMTGAPVNKASVKLFQLAEGSESAVVGSYSATTDASGRFQTRVERGRYAMLVVRNGYAKLTMGMAGTSKPASIVSLACTDATELRFLMTPQGVIAGTVVDEDNEPLANAMVEAFNYRSGAQAGRVRAASAARTDDRGKYRIFGISPGRYYVSVRIQDSPGNGGLTAEEPQTSYVPTYYPGTNHASAATPIPVVGGQESVADFTLAKVSTVHAAGRFLTDFHGGCAVIFAFPGEHPAWDSGERRGGIDDKTGKWIIRGLQPGLYTLTCDRMDAGVRTGVRVAVNVGTKDLDNLELKMSRYPDLAGKITVEGGGRLPLALKVSLQPRQALASMGYAAAEPDSEGAFVLQATSPDLSDVTISNLPSGYFVKSIQFAGREVSDTGIELGLGGSHNVSIVISPKGATLDGRVLDAQDKPVTDATVLLVPDTGHRQLKSRYYTATTDPNGRFAITGIRAGDYTAVAWDSLDAMDYTDPEALEIADKQGETVKIQTDGRQTLQLRTLSAAGLLP